MSIQHAIITILMEKIEHAILETGVKEVAIVGVFLQTQDLEKRFFHLKRKAAKLHPPFAYCTDNAAMIAITGYYKYLRGEFSKQDITAQARYILIVCNLKLCSSVVALPSGVSFVSTALLSP